MTSVNTIDNATLNGSFSFGRSQLTENIFKDVPANLVNSVSSFRTMLFSLLEKASNMSSSATPILAKVTGGFLSETTFNALGIAIKARDKGWCEAVVTGIPSSLIAGGATAKYIIPAVSQLPPGRAIVVGGIAIAAVYTMVDKMITNTYEYLDGKNIDFTFSEVNQKLLFGTNITDLNTLKMLAESFEFYGNVGDNIQVDSITFEINNGDSKTTYQIQPGDSVYGICDKYDIDLEELLRLNPWLADRFSKDGKFALIRPGEKLKLPGGGSALLSSGKPSPDIPFNEADKAGIPGVDPVLIDLNNDGKISTVGVENGTYFDHGNDGFAEMSAWVDRNDGILVIDKNNDGIKYRYRFFICRTYKYSFLS